MGSPGSYAFFAQHITLQDIWDFWIPLKVKHHVQYFQCFRKMYCTSLLCRQVSMIKEDALQPRVVSRHTVDIRTPTPVGRWLVLWTFYDLQWFIAPNSYRLVENLSPKMWIRRTPCCHFFDYFGMGSSQWVKAYHLVMTNIPMEKGHRINLCFH